MKNEGVPFIVGAGRSGTTLLRLMLDAHPDLAIPPETHFLPEVAATCAESLTHWDRWKLRLVARLVPRVAHALEAAHNQAHSFLTTVICHRTWKDFHLEGERLRERILAIKPFHLGEALRAFYRLYTEKFNKPRWGDKTPGYVTYMELIHRLLPEARFIHLIRDGRDVALSIKGLWFGPNSVAEAAEWWVTRIKDARRQAKSLPHYLEVRYEDLLVDTEPTLQKICSFIELPWDPVVLTYYKRSGDRLAELAHDVTAPDGKTKARAEDRLGIHALTRQPPQRDRIAGWKSKMTDADRRLFESVAGDTLRDLGYAA